MDLELKNQLFIVGGASQGLGRAITDRLVMEGAKVLAISRSEEKLRALRAAHPDNVTTLAVDLSHESSLNAIKAEIAGREVAGVVINSGGPPAMPTLDTKLSDWDNAYRSVVRWKIGLTQAILPQLIEKKYGRLLFIESVTTKQPVANLVLSNSMRLAVVGYVKTLSQEIGKSGVTLNILGPGYHETQRMINLFKTNSELKGIHVNEVKKNFKDQTAVGEIGDPTDFATLAAWLLSPYSKYITGQTLTIDGGLVKGVLG